MIPAHLKRAIWGAFRRYQIDSSKANLTALRALQDEAGKAVERKLKTRASGN